MERAVDVSALVDFLRSHEDIDNDLSLSIDSLNNLLADYSGPQGFVVRPYLEAVNTPALWLYGALDRSNPTFHDIAILEDIEAKCGSDFTILVFPFADHDLIDERTGQLPNELVPQVFGWLDGKVALAPGSRNTSC
jgi:pimeloyl-ACP methyl ester carboxylesterase